jgi:hypothetical protein
MVTCQAPGREGDAHVELDPALPCARPAAGFRRLRAEPAGGRVARWREGRGQHRRALRGGRRVIVADGDDQNDTWGEHTSTIAPEIRDMATETHMEYGSRVGIWRIGRMLDSFGIDACEAANRRCL